MSRPATDRLKLNPPLGMLPALQYLLPVQLRIDEAYQRSLDTDASRTLVRSIAQHWNWDLCQPLVVSRRTDGALYVIDGQHRLEAARLRGDIAQLPAVVVQYADPADEAASFVHLNQQRRPLSKIDLFKAAIASGDSEAIAIVAALKAAGLQLAGHSNYTAWKPGMVANISGIERAWRRHGKAVCEQAMLALAKGFPNEVLRYAGTIWPGVVAVCAAEMRASRAFDNRTFERFCNMLSLRTQIDWRADVAKTKGEDPQLKFAAASARVFLQAWDGANVQPRIAAPEPVKATPAPVQRAPLPIAANPKPAPLKAPVGLDALKPRWCEQYERRVSAPHVAVCKSAFCKAKARA